MQKEIKYDFGASLECADEFYSIIKAHQQNLHSIAQLNWNLDSINDVLKSNNVIRYYNMDSLEGSFELGAFIIYRDLVGVAEVLLLGTKIEWQSNGFMKELFALLKEKYFEIWLEVHEFNLRALEFYIGQGFKIDGIRPKYYTDGKSALVMSWKSTLAI